MKQCLPSKAWEIFGYAKGLLSVSGLYRIFHVEHAQLYRYAKDPLVYEDASTNPINQIRHMLRELSETGGAEGREVSKVALNLMAKDIGLKVVEAVIATPSRENLHAEFLAIFERLSKLQQVVQASDNPLVVEIFIDKVKVELDVFLSHYEQDFAEKEGNVRFSKTKPTETSFWAKFWNFGR